MTVRMSLLGAMSIQMRCEYLSDLRYLDSGRRARLARRLEGLPPEEADLRDWNDALAYLTGQAPQPDAAQAKAALIAGLTAR